jgi:hypothetical protein
LHFEIEELSRRCTAIRKRWSVESFPDEPRGGPGRRVPIHESRLVGVVHVPAGRRVCGQESAAAGRDTTMDPAATPPVPSGHTAEGGVLVGSDNARRRLVVFEDPQCPYCRQFEETSGDLLRREVAAGAVSVEYRMRCFLGPESVRADNALALAAEAGRFDQLRREVFAAQPPEHSGGFTVEDLLDLGRRVDLADPTFVTGVREGRYETWVIQVDQTFQEQDPQGTPAALLGDEPVEPSALYDRHALGELLRG